MAELIKYIIIGLFAISLISSFFQHFGDNHNDTEDVARYEDGHMRGFRGH